MQQNREKLFAGPKNIWTSYIIDYLRVLTTELMYFGVFRLAYLERTAKTDDTLLSHEVL